MTTIRPRRLIPLMGLLLVAGAAACGPADGQDPADSSSARGSSGAGRSPGPMLRGAVDALIKADTGHYLQEVFIPDLQDEAVFSVSGDYALSAKAAGANIELQEAGEVPLVLDGRIVGRTFYLHSAGWPAALEHCWLGMDAAEVAEATGQSPDAGLVGQYPAALLALPSARGTQFDEGGGVTGTVDLLFGLSAVYPKAPAAVKAAAEGGRSTARFQLAGGRLVGWTVDGADVLAGLRATNAGSTGDVPDKVADNLDRIQARITLTDPGRGADISPPPARRVMTSAEADSGKGCGA
jgi:hypothetical protein